MIIGQTENIGNTIMNDLESQREILVGAQGNMIIFFFHTIIIIIFLLRKGKYKRQGSIH